MVTIEHEHKPRSAPSPKKKTSGTLLKYLVGASALQVVLLVVIAVQLSGLGGVSGVAGAAIAQPTEVPQAAPAPEIDMDALVDDDYILGNKDAKVTIVEFSDYECPFCARFYTETLSRIKQKYIDTGQVRFVYRDFPLSFHAQAEPAAVAANCAGEQGKYYEYHDKIFNAGGSGGKTAADYENWAREIGLNFAEWKECLADPAQKAEVQKDMQDGAAVGIQGTPGFVINGQVVSGAQPFNVFEQIIEAALLES